MNHLTPANSSGDRRSPSELVVKEASLLTWSVSTEGARREATKSPDEFLLLTSKGALPQEKLSVRMTHEKCVKMI